ncbi:hypothetical protein ACFSR7_34380 [Cohnella sp. GCM10020058]
MGRTGSGRRHGLRFGTGPAMNGNVPRFAGSAVGRTSAYRTG